MAGAQVHIAAREAVEAAQKAAKAFETAERKQEKGRDTAFAFFYFNFSLNNFCKKSRELKKKD